MIKIHRITTFFVSSRSTLKITCGVSATKIRNLRPKRGGEHPRPFDIGLCSGPGGERGVELLFNDISK